MALELLQVGAQKMGLAIADPVAQLLEAQDEFTLGVSDDLHQLGAQLLIIGKLVERFEGRADDREVVESVLEARVGNPKHRFLGKAFYSIGVFQAAIGVDQEIEAIISGQTLEQSHPAVVRLPV